MNISEDQLKDERKLFKRLLLSSDDLKHAKEFAQALLELPKSEDKRLWRGLQTALIVSYWRPFTNNEGSKDASLKLPTKKFLSEFDDKNKRLHDHVKSLRNTVMAHSDSSVYGINVTVSISHNFKWVIPTSWNPWVKMQNDEIETIIDNIEKIVHKISEEMIRIQELLPVGKNF